MDSPPNKIYQFATFNSLLVGNYDGVFPLVELRKIGNLGLGTWNSLDGEMICVDGQFYQLKADGICYIPEETDSIPFGVVTNFQAQQSFNIIKQLDFKGITSFLDTNIPDHNYPVVARIDGLFEKVHYRSVPKQNKPYPSFLEVAKKQPEFTRENIEGTIVIFRFPGYFQGLNVVGYHFHFVSKERTTGGHVLNLLTKNVNLQVAECSDFEMKLPVSEMFASTNLSFYNSKDVEAAEGKH